MSRLTTQRSPNIRRVSHIGALSDLLARVELERGSERHPGCVVSQSAWDDYLDAIALASASGEDEDAIVAGRLYLRWADKRKRQEPCDER